jgi:hypothetical protein
MQGATEEAVNSWLILIIPCRVAAARRFDWLMRRNVSRLRCLSDLTMDCCCKNGLARSNRHNLCIAKDKCITAPEIRIEMRCQIN